MISKLVLGTVQFGLAYGVNNDNGKPSQNTSFSILEKAYHLGVKTLDTAEAYGDSHKIIELFHKRVDYRFKIITKFSSSVNGYPTDWEERVKQHCENFDIPKLECYMFHSFDEFKTIIESDRGVLKKLKNSKYVEKVGVSVYENWQIDKLLGFDDIDLIQLPFNLFDNEKSRKKTIIKAKDKNITIHTRSAFLQGLFFLPKKRITKDFSGLIDGFNILDKILNKKNISKLDLAINYPFSKNYIDNVLIGVDSVEQLEKNTTSLLNFTATNIYSEIDKIEISNKNLLNPSKW